MTNHALIIILLLLLQIIVQTLVSAKIINYTPVYYLKTIYQNIDKYDVIISKDYVHIFSNGHLILTYCNQTNSFFVKNYVLKVNCFLTLVDPSAMFWISKYMLKFKKHMK